MTDRDRSDLGPRGRESGSGDGIIGFYAIQLDGPLEIMPAFRLDCRGWPLERGKPFTVGYAKSGGVSSDDPNASFHEAYLNDPVFRLPTGTWRIGALTGFDVGACGASRKPLDASAVANVGPTDGASPVDPSAPIVFLELQGAIQQGCDSSAGCIWWATLTDRTTGTQESAGFQAGPLGRAVPFRPSWCPSIRPGAYSIEAAIYARSVGGPAGALTPSGRCQADLEVTGAESIVTVEVSFLARSCAVDVERTPREGTATWTPDPAWPTPPPAPPRPPVDPAIQPVRLSAMTSEALHALYACGAFDPSLGGLGRVSAMGYLVDLTNAPDYARISPGAPPLNEGGSGWVIEFRGEMPQLMSGESWVDATCVYAAEAALVATGPVRDLTTGRFKRGYWSREPTYSLPGLVP